MSTRWTVVRDQKGLQVIVAKGEVYHRVRPWADQQAAEIAAFAAQRYGLEPEHAVRLKRSGGNVEYRIIKRHAPNARDTWRRRTRSDGKPV